MFRSLWEIMPVLALVVGASVQANEIAQRGESMQQAQSMEQMCGIPEGENCCMARGCSNGNGFVVEVDFLWWRAENVGFSFAYEQKDPTYLTNTALPLINHNNGSVIRLDSMWKPGFRVGAGWNSWYDRWDFFCDYTWYQNHSAKTRTVAPNVNVLVGYFPQWPVFPDLLLAFAEGLPIAAFQRVHGSWKIQFNCVDAELGRAYYITKQFSLRPHWGARGAWINQRFTDNFNLPQPAPVLIAELDFYGENNWWGAGPRLGVWGDLNLGYGFSIVGKTSVSLLYGQTKTKYCNDFREFFSTEFIDAVRFHDQFWQLVPNLQIFFGLEWGGGHALRPSLVWDRCGLGGKLLVEPVQYSCCSLWFDGTWAYQCKPTAHNGRFDSQRTP